MKGATSFGPQDGELFSRLGRNAELARLRGWALDDQIPLVVLYGESGVGKTSVLRSGLPHELISEEARVLYWEALPEGAEERFLQSIRDQWGDEENVPEDLKSLAQAKPGPRTVVVLDQFEQLSREKHPALFDLLRDALTADPPYPITWVVAFRREYLSNWQDFELDALTTKARTRVEKLSLKRFSEAAAHRILATLVEASGLEIEEKVLRQVVAGVQEGGTVSPVDIGVSLLILSEISQTGAQAAFTLSDFQLAGGQVGLLVSYLQTLLEGFSEHQRSEIFRALLLLVDLDTDQRIAEGRTAAKVIKEVKSKDPGRLIAALDYLASAKARVLEMKPGNAEEPPRYRLTHERLIPALRRLTGRLLADHEQAESIVEHRYRIWLREKKRKFLLSGKELRQVIRHRAQIRWGRDAPEKRKFVSLSTRYRTQKLVATAVGAVLLLALGAAGQNTVESSRHRALLESWGLPRDLYDRQEQLAGLSLAQEINSHDWIKEGIISLRLLSSARLASLDGLPKSVTTLDLSRAGVTSLEGLHEGLTTLKLDAPKLTSLDGLPKSVTTLDLSRAGVTSLEGLPEGLTTLKLDAPKLTSLDGLPKSVTTLDLSRARVTSLEGLPEGLTTLKLDGTLVTSLKGLPEGLTTLNLNATAITSLEGLPKSVTTLDLNGTLVTSLEGLPEGLTTLKLNDTRITSLEGLHEGLTTLALIGTGVTSLEGLPKSVTTLDLFAPKLTSLEGLHEGLTTLDLYGLGITSLEGLPKSVTTLQLRDLGQRDMVITSLEGLHEGLTTLKLQGRITSLEGLPKSVTTLESSGTLVTSLKGLPEGLTTLNLNATAITSLEGLPKSVTTLDLSRTTVTSLEEVPKSVTTLDLSGSRITSLEGLHEGLTTLAVRFTRVTSLEGVPKSVTTLDLSGSTITSLEGLHEGLTTLDVSFTRITSLEGLPKSVRELSL